MKLKQIRLGAQSQPGAEAGDVFLGLSEQRVGEVPAGPPGRRPESCRSESARRTVGVADLSHLPSRLCCLPTAGRGLFAVGP